MKNSFGPLKVICGLLALSAVIRIGMATTEALASSAPTDAKSVSTDVHKITTVELDLLIDELNKREDEILRKEKDLEAEEAELKQLQSIISLKFEEMQQAEENLRTLMSMATTAAEDDVSRLIAVYENMKPKNAAPLFEEMDPEFAAGFLTGMRADAAAAIMAGLNPSTAYAISVVIAGRNVEQE